MFNDYYNERAFFFQNFCPICHCCLIIISRVHRNVKTRFGTCTPLCHLCHIPRLNCFNIPLLILLLPYLLLWFNYKSHYNLVIASNLSSIYLPKVPLLSAIWKCLKVPQISSCLLLFLWFFLTLECSIATV